MCECVCVYGPTKTKGGPGRAYMNVGRQINHATRTDKLFGGRPAAILASCARCAHIHTRLVFFFIFRFCFIFLFSMTSPLPRLIKLRRSCVHIIYFYYTVCPMHTHTYNRYILLCISVHLYTILYARSSRFVFRTERKLVSTL